MHCYGFNLKSVGVFSPSQWLLDLFYVITLEMTEDADIRSFPVEGKVQSLGCRATLEAGRGALRGLSQWWECNPRDWQRWALGSWPSCWPSCLRDSSVPLSGVRTNLALTVIDLISRWGLWALTSERRSWQLSAWREWGVRWGVIWFYSFRKEE